MTSMLLRRTHWVMGPVVLLGLVACGQTDDDGKDGAVAPEAPEMGPLTEPPPVDGAEYRELDVNGIRMRVVEQGEGPLVLLAHG